MKGMRRTMEERLEGGLRGGMLPSCCSVTTGAMQNCFRDAHCPFTALGRDGKNSQTQFIFPIERKFCPKSCRKTGSLLVVLIAVPHYLS